MKKHLHSILRWGIYLSGLALLAAGITLNSLTGLGASAIVSVPFAISQGTGLNFGNLTLVLYGLFVAAQLFLAGRQRSWSCLLQIPLSILFTRGMNLIKALVPYRSGYLPADLALLILTVLLTGIGAAMTVDMQLIPNPGDGIVYCLSQKTERELGLCKNIFDLCCVGTAVLVGAVFGNPFLGVGAGTAVSMLGVGRTISWFNGHFRGKLLKAAGLASSPIQNS